MTQIDTNLERRAFTVHPFYILHPNVNHDDVDYDIYLKSYVLTHWLSDTIYLGSPQTFSMMNY